MLFRDSAMHGVVVPTVCCLPLKFDLSLIPAATCILLMTAMTNALMTTGCFAQVQLAAELTLSALGKTILPYY